jgi:6-phosphogluconolactonase
MKKIFLFLALAIAWLAAATQQSYLLVGTYTGGKSEGIYVYRFNSVTGEVKPVSMIKTSNPSYLAVSPNQRFVYAVHENANNGHGGEIASFSFDRSTGNLSFLNQQPSGGDHPCYVSVDATGRWVAAANYTSGSLSVLPVNTDGTLGQPASIQHAGSGPNKDRQAGPHVHCTIFSRDNKYLFASDLGIDKVMIYAFDASSGKLAPAPGKPIATDPGAGPRHLTFHPNNRYAYLIQELTGNVSSYRYANGQFTLLQTISALEPGFKGAVGSADIHTSADGRFLYASNRGESNNITIFRIDPASGKLSTVGYQSTMGKAPRNFSLDPGGNFLLAANQDSDEIVIFKVDKKTGLLKDTGKRISVGKPVCVKWIAAK